MALRIYSDFPFVPENEIGRVDTYTGDGSTTTFELRNKSSVTTGETIQADLVYYNRPLGGFTFPDTSHFTLSSAPPLNSQILAPSTATLVYEGFDQASVPGVSGTANVIDKTFYLAVSDTDDLTSSIYENQPSAPGIAILFSNLVTAAGASTSWCQLACANVNGDALTYQATGTTLYTGTYYAFTQLAASATSGSTSLLTTGASALTLGDFLTINPGGGTSEDVRITSRTGNNITISGTNYPHYENEFIFMRGRQFWSRVTIPIDALGGEAGNLINLALTSQSAKVSRL